MSVPSHVLVIDSKGDPEIKRALEGPNVDVRFAPQGSEAIGLCGQIQPDVIVLEARNAPDSWRLAAEIWEDAQKRPHLPFLIIILEGATGWNVDHFGPVRFSDRRNLGEVFREILAEPGRGSETDRADEVSWASARERVRVKGDKRFHAEVDRMRALGIVDERGRSTSAEWPADMKPESKTDIAD